MAASPAPPVEKLASRGKQILMDAGTAGVAMSADAAGSDTVAMTEAARKAAKLEAMAARVAAMKSKKKGTQ